MKTDTWGHHMRSIKNDLKRPVILICLPLALVLFKITSFRMLGFTSHDFLRQIIIGLVLGLIGLIFSFVVQILFYGQPDYLPNLKATVVFSLYLFFINAFAEELFFRGFLQNIFIQYSSHTVIGIVLASLVFGLYHILMFRWNIKRAILAFISGVIFGAIFYVTNSIIVVWIVHGFIDLGFSSETLGGYLLWGIIKKKQITM